MAKQDYTFRCRVRNWSDYNRALINRGRLTLWFDEDAVPAENVIRPEIIDDFLRPDVASGA
jgi:hypothetical protein